MLWKFGLALAIVTVAIFPRAATAAPVVDPLNAAIETRDADRFAAVFDRTGGKPSVVDLQRGYLDGSGRGVAIFTPDRIINAANLVAAVKRDPERYRYAIKNCLPLVNSLTAELRATYLAYRGLVPERPLPAIYIVFGASNSGGTASSEAQVLGLEVMCGPGTTPEQFRAAMRGIFAHETVHSWQDPIAGKRLVDPLLTLALREGVPDYLASLVTGSVPSPDRDKWAGAHEAELWAEFQRDRVIARTEVTKPFEFTPKGEAAIKRWFGNFGSPPKGWPAEAGYWVGMRIAEAYVARSSDKQAAIRSLIALDDPQAILQASGYDPGKGS